jgi:transcriptional regulator with XRE-family HTH domain
VGIKQIRKKQNVSQKELARKAEISPQFLCDIEHGRRKPSFDTAIKLAEALDIEDIKSLKA